MKVFLKDGAILEFIPQRSPFIMVDKLYEMAGAKATTGLLIAAENPLVKNGRFQESGLIENIAQSAALMSGYHAVKGGTAPKKGFIGMIKDLKVYALPHAGQELTTEVEQTADILNACIIKGTVKDALSNVLAECELRIFFENEGIDK